MEEIIRFLDSAAPVVFVILGLAGILVLRWMLSAWHEWRTSIFGLEKENAQRKFTSALTLIILLVIFGIGEFVVKFIVFPNIPNIQALATPTMEIRNTPAPTQQSLSQVTLTAEGFIPTMEVAREDGCIAGTLEWTNPVEGSTLKGEVVLMGTVSIPNLGFYKYEYSPVESDSWVTIAAGDVIIVDQPLGGDGSGRWDTSSLVPGDYFLRLIATDNVNNVFPACTIRVQITAP